MKSVDAVCQVYREFRLYDRFALERSHVPRQLLRLFSLKSSRQRVFDRKANLVRIQFGLCSVATMNIVSQ